MPGAGVKGIRKSRVPCASQTPFRFSPKVGSGVKKRALRRALALFLTGLQRWFKPSATGNKIEKEI